MACDAIRGDVGVPSVDHELSDSGGRSRLAVNDGAHLLGESLRHLGERTADCAAWAGASAGRDALFEGGHERGGSLVNRCGTRCHLHFLQLAPPRWRTLTVVRVELPHRLVVHFDVQVHCEFYTRYRTQFKGNSNGSAVRRAIPTVQRQIPYGRTPFSMRGAAVRRDSPTVRRSFSGHAWTPVPRGVSGEVAGRNPARPRALSPDASPRLTAGAVVLREE